jgi:hypothetical protein
MLPGWVPIGVMPFGALPSGDSLAVLGPFPDLIADQNADLIFLLEAFPLPLEGDAGNGPPYPIAAMPFGALEAGDLWSADKVRLSDVGYITEAADAPAHTPYLPRLLTPYSFEISLPIPGESRGLGTAGFGVIEIANDDGRLDSLLARSWEGRDFTILLGGTYNVGRADERTLDFDEFETLFRGTVRSIATESGRLVLATNDVLSKLDNPVQSNLYAGTGGMEGGDAIEGLPKPLCFGEAYNVDAVLVDDVDLIYQVHDGSVQAIPEVRDQGIALTLAGDIVGLGLGSLSDWSPVGGQYVTDLAQGLFRIGGSPAGTITADVEGDDAGGYVSSTAEVVRRIATVYGGFSDPSDLEAVDFAGFPITDAVGFYTGTREVRVLEAISELMAAADGWASSTRDARLRIGPNVAPEGVAAAEALTDAEIEEISDESMPEPVWRVRVGYQPIWRVQDEDGLAGGVSAADRALYSQERRWATAEDTGVQSTHRSARELEIPAFFADKAPAEAMAAAVLDRLKVRRRRYRCRVPRSVFNRQVGDVLTVTSADSDLEAGRNLWLHELGEVGADRTSELGLWG